MKRIFTPKANGFFVANLVSFTVIALTRYFLLSGNSGTLIFSEFVIVPIIMGIISTWYWRNLQLSTGRLTILSIYNALVAVILSFVFLGEGAICLLIVSPLLVVFILTGALIGRSMFKNDNKTINVSIAAALLFIFIADSLSTHNYINRVSDQVVINAPVSKVWQYVPAFKRIKKDNEYWLFRIGMPSPVQSTVEAYKLGAKRKCIFSNGYVFEEVISAYKPEHNLTFDVTHQPKDPEIMQHIDILRGQFILKDNGNGTTTLTGNSWYRLYVFPVWYYDVWAQSITRNVHLRVMEHIKELSEAK